MCRCNGGKLRVWVQLQAGVGVPCVLNLVTQIMHHVSEIVDKFFSEFMKFWIDINHKNKEM